MIRLYIENTEIELNENVQFSITKEFEELSNPTTIINDWSKTVSIPFTVKNHRTFGYIYNPDKITIASNIEFTGIYFDPLKKLDFRLEYDGNIMMTGYAKMNEIKQINGSGTYDITLFGLLGNLFQELKKITFDSTVDDSTYLIHGEDYVSEYIDKSLIYNSWVSAEQNYYDVKKKTDSGYNVTDIIGFAPNNSFNNDFNYDTYQAYSNESNKFEDTLGDSFKEATGIDATTVIPDGLLPREIGEYRSYLQLPFIYWNKLFQIFQNKAETITGYTFDLDKDWFNTSNPYWYKLVYMLQLSDIKKGDLYRNTYNKLSTFKYSDSGLSFGEWAASADFTYTITHDLCTRGIVSEDFQNVLTHTNTVNRFNFVDGVGAFNFNYSINSYIGVITLGSYIKNSTGLLLTVKAIGSNGHTTEQTILVRNSGSSITYPNVASIIEAPTSGSTYLIVLPTMNFLLTCSKADFGDYVSFKVSARWIESSNPITGSSATGDVIVYLNTSSRLYVSIPKPTWFHSGSLITLNDLWNKEFNIFEEIIKYCKMFRIVIYEDSFNKKLVFRQAKNYFQNYEIVNWTNIVDKSKDFRITPVTFDSKYVLFNYEDSDTKLGKEYQEHYGVRYGEYRLITDYNFNTEETNLFDKIPQSIVSSDNVLSWTNLFDYHTITYSFPAEIFVHNRDKDKKSLNIFGSFYFHNGLAAFSTEAALHMRDVYISDDTAFQQLNNTFFYTLLNDEMKSCSTYPKLDIVNGDNLCVFNIPKENYTYLDNYSGKHSIYYNFWEKYINERYNRQNKKLTCYVRIKPSTWSNFKYTKFARIENQIYFVNKIYDYDITSSDSTKVDLITIQDVNGYTTSNYTYDYIITSTHNITIPYDAYKKISIKSSGNWVINSDDWSDYLVAYPQSGSAGITTVYIGTTNQEYGGKITFNIFDGSSIIASDYVLVGVGGTNTITVSQWFNQILKGNYDYIDITSGSSWSVVAKDNRNNVTVDMGTESGNSGMTRRRLLVSSTSNTGIIDYYLENTAGDITSFRVNVVS